MFIDGESNVTLQTNERFKTELLFLEFLFLCESPFMVKRFIKL